MYAYIVDAPLNTATASSNAIEIKINKRPIELKYDENNDGNRDKVEVFRNTDDPITAVSASKITGTIVGTDYDLNPKTFKGTDLFNMSGGPDVSLDLSMVKLNKAWNYKAEFTGYTLSSDFIENYEIDNTSNYVDYKVHGRYYVKYILEYNGKKWVSSNVVDESEVDEGVAMKIKPTDYKSVSWGSADGKDEGVLGKDNTITRWLWQNSDNSEKGYIDDPEGYAWVAPDDYVVYAIVTAVATKVGDDKAVMIESIPPVKYDGTNHVQIGGTKGNKNGNLQITIYDETKGNREYLTYGTDYTVSYKNNKNASVAYNPSVSGDSADSGKNGEDATFRQLFPEKKRPQVIIKGKGDYKGLKATVYFDILPEEIEGVDGISAFYLPNKTLKVGEKPYATIYTNYQKDTTKTYFLKEGKYNNKNGSYTKDYIKTIYRLTKNTAGDVVKKEKVTNLKKIAEGDYRVVIEGKNNFRGEEEEDFTVKNGYLLSKQKFSWKKKVNWSASPKVKVDDFGVKIYDKKAKADIAVVKFADEDDKAGVYVSEIEKRNNKVWDTVDDNPATAETYEFADAGVYRIYFTSGTKLRESSSIYGNHYVQVTVAGTKLKASNFKVNGGKALEYTGKATEEPVKVELKKNYATDQYSKIPLGYTAKNVKANTEVDALDNYRDGYIVHDDDNDVYYIDEADGYVDRGAEPYATFSKRGLYTVRYKGNNAEIGTYNIYIKPTGKYYADGKYIHLTYKRSGINLSKVASTGAIKVIAKDVEANVGGTPAYLLMTVSGYPAEKYPLYGVEEVSENTYYVNKAHSNGNLRNDTIFNNYFRVTYSKNKKTGTAVATIKANPKSTFAKTNFKGSLKVPFTIVDKKIDSIGEYDKDALADPGAVVADIQDCVKPANGKDPKPSVKLYQVNAAGSGVTALKLKTDYEWALGKTVSGEGTYLNVTAPAKGSFAFTDEKNKESGATLQTKGAFNTYGKKAKIVITLSEGSASGYDAAKKGYTYTGENIVPTITSITIDGKTQTFPAGIGASSNFIVKYNNNVKVGNKATVTVKLIYNKDKKEYPYGGTVTKKFKIVPQTNQNLILSK